MKSKNEYINDLWKNDTGKYIWKRSGKCDYVKCQSACCRFNVLKSFKNNGHEKSYHDMQDYTSQTISNTMVKTINRHDILMSPRLCPHIKIEGGCELHGKRTQPEVCKYFPMVASDAVYIAVKHVCGYKFKKVKNPNYKQDIKIEEIK